MVYTSSNNAYNPVVIQPVMLPQMDTCWVMETNNPIPFARIIAKITDRRVGEPLCKSSEKLLAAHIKKPKPKSVAPYMRAKDALYQYNIVSPWAPKIPYMAIINGPYRAKAIPPAINKKALISKIIFRFKVFLLK